MSRAGSTAALLLLAFSFAARSPRVTQARSDEAVAIAKAFKTTTKARLRKIAYQFNVVRIRVSTVNPHFGRGNFVPKAKYRNSFQAGYGVAKRARMGSGRRSRSAAPMWAASGPSRARCGWT